MWQSVFGYEMEVKVFPSKTQIGTFKNETDIDEWLLVQTESKIYGIDYSFIAHAPYVFTSFIQECLSRYNFQKKGYTSYSNHFDDLPAIWVETVSLIDSELEKALEKKRHERN